MLKHFYMKAPAPPEYLQLILCRDIYHCTPVELDQIPIETVMAHLICHTEEQKYLNEKSKAKKRGS